MKDLDRLGIVIDLVLIAEVGLWQILDLAPRPVILSHTTPTMFPDTSPAARHLLGGKLPRPRLKLPRLTEALAARGHGDGVILRFLGENYLRVFEEVWGG